MNYQLTSTGIELPITKDFNLAQTLNCGQCFRWNAQPDGSYFGAAFGHTLHVAQTDHAILLMDCTEREFRQIWCDYFDCDFDYGEVRRALTHNDPVLAQAAKFAPGMRILRQDPWEALVSFIISQNNNIPRIKGIVDRLCNLFGEPLGEVCSFPSAERLASLTESDLAPLRSGFRAKYILSAAQHVASGDIELEALRTMPIDEARQKLMTIHGVGPKVAECALLYGLHRLEAFPMDVWMKRAMAALFPGKTPADFGEYAGIAQQYIFHYSRNNPQLFEKAKQSA
jgi:N-glycosylase/DNA lyase